MLQHLLPLSTEIKKEEEIEVDIDIDEFAEGEDNTEKIRFVKKRKEK